jgi:hypothetical protein
VHVHVHLCIRWVVCATVTAEGVAGSSACLPARLCQLEPTIFGQVVTASVASGSVLRDDFVYEVFQQLKEQTGQFSISYFDINSRQEGGGAQ